MNKKRIAQSFSKARHSYDSEATAQREIAETLCLFLEERKIGHINNILEFGCGTGILTRQLLDQFSPNNYTANDLCQTMQGHLPNEQNITFVTGDAETMSFKENYYDLIVSSSTIQWFSDPFGFLKKMQSNLLPNGWIAFSTFGERNLFELQEIGIKGLMYHTKEKWKKWMDKEFQHVEVREKIITLEFDSTRDAIYHLKETGVNGLDEKPRNRTEISNLLTKYNSFAQEIGKITLTFHAIFIIAQKKK